MHTILKLSEYSKVCSDVTEMLGEILGDEAVAIVDGAAGWLKYIRNKYRIGEYSRREPRSQSAVHPGLHKLTVWLRDYDEINLKTVVMDFYPRAAKDKSFILVVYYAMGSNPDAWDAESDDPDVSIINPSVQVVPATAAAHRIMRVRPGTNVDISAVLKALHRKCLREAISED